MIEAKLSDEERQQIRAAWAKGTKQRVLAQQYGVTQGCISKIVAGIPKVRASELRQRRCVDCGVPLRYKTRCPECNKKWHRVYNQDYYLRTHPRQTRTITHA